MIEFCLCIGGKLHRSFQCVTRPLDLVRDEETYVMYEVPFARLESGHAIVYGLSSLAKEDVIKTAQAFLINLFLHRTKIRP